MKTLAQLAEDYLRHLSIERGLSKNTISAYRRDLSSYLGYLEKQNIAEPSQILESHITGYVSSISESGALSANSIARMLAGVRGLHLSLIHI